MLKFIILPVLIFVILILRRVFYAVDIFYMAFVDFSYDLLFLCAFINVIL